MWVMAGGMVMAQTAPPSQKVAPGPKPPAAKPAMTQAQPAAAAKKPASPMKPKPAAPVAKAAPKPAAKPSARTVKVPAKPAAGAVKKAAVKTPVSAAAAKRDPFISPIREQGPAGPNCSTGKKCLAINAIVLRGIVKSQSGMIAVVEGASRRISYFLRENDPVFNGYVVKITPDTVVFRENVMDRLGRTGTRDVVMKVVAPAV
jgi:Tfp pilus assembly protein PilP